MILSTYFIKRRIAKLIRKSSERQARFCPLPMAKHLLFFYNQRDASQIEPILRKLKDNKFHVSSLVFCPDGITIERLESIDNLICRKTDLNFLGLPSSQLIENVKSLQADVLINVGREKDYTLLFLMLLHPASFKTGIKWFQSDAYDLVVSPMDENKDVGFLCEQILFYLQSIRAK